MLNEVVDVLRYIENNGDANDQTNGEEKRSRNYLSMYLSNLVNTVAYSLVSNFGTIWSFQARKSPASMCNLA